MDLLSLKQIAEMARGTICRGDDAREIPGVTTDSREIQYGELFLALTGDKFDGHHFLAQAEARGAAGAIVSDAASFAGCGERFAVIEVDDTLLGYQRLAAAYRQSLRLRTVAITGSNGKTSTKDFTAAVLGHKFRVLKTAGNFNNHIGVPRTLLRASKEDEIAVLEIGMNHPGEIKPLAEMAKPDVAIVTNIGTAHIEYMGSRESIAQEKGVLVEAVNEHGFVILPADDPFTLYLSQRAIGQVITAGLRNGDLRAEKIRATMEGSQFEVVYRGARSAAAINVPGEHMIVNALLAVGAGIVLGLSLDEAANGLASASLTKGRLQWQKIAGLQIVDDSYNANPDSMVAALSTLARLPAVGRRIAVLGKMGELGSHSEAGHRRVGEAAGSLGFECVIAVGSGAALIAQSAKISGVLEVHTFESTEEAARFLDQTATPTDLILIKGSRSAGMERVISALALLKNETAEAGPVLTH